MSKVSRKISKKPVASKNKLVIFGVRCYIHPVNEETIKSESVQSWCNDETLLIDKYDVRCSLSEIPTSLDPNCYILTKEEEFEESECDKERYFDLFEKQRIKDLYKKQLDEETELGKTCKENKSQFSTVEYNYDEEHQSIPCESLAENSPNIDIESEDDNDLPYICPGNLQLPEDMILPTTVREAATIEHTAQFIANQGPQMEVLLKAKQASNKKFRFLDMDDALNPFYKCLELKIRSAEYIPEIRHKHHLRKQDEEESAGHENKFETNSKIDITNTSYYLLINKFKPKIEEQEVKKSIDSNDEELTTDTKSEEQEGPSVDDTPTKDDSDKEYEHVYRQYYSYYYNYYLNQSQNNSNNESNATTKIEPHEVENATVLSTNIAVQKYLQNKLIQEENNKKNQEMLVNQCQLVKYLQYYQEHGEEFEINVKNINTEKIDFINSENELNPLFIYFKDNFFKHKPKAIPTWKDYLLKTTSSSTNETENRLIKIVNSISKLNMHELSESTTESKASDVTSQQSSNQQKSIFPTNQTEDIKSIRKRKATEFLEKLKIKRQNNHE